MNTPSCTLALMNTPSYTLALMNISSCTLALPERGPQIGGGAKPLARSRTPPAPRPSMAPSTV
jgi:hypothetical protein